jgi:hypothetical protein
MDSGEAAADSTVEDSGMDSTVGPMDSGADTSAPQDTGVDAPEETGSPVDSGADAPTDSPADTGVDTGVDSGSPLVPCTTAGQMNCVQCDGWVSTLCTPTEAAIVQRDIEKGHVTAAGPEPHDPNNTYGNEACYECLFHGGCVDDDVIGDTDHECEDMLTVGTAGECKTTLACLLSTACADKGVSTCYCGTAGVTTTCQGNPAPGPINGVCADQIAAGLGLDVKNGTAITKALNDYTKASGMADQILTCGLANMCKNCFQ